jgi:hypothetical protein
MHKFYMNNKSLLNGNLSVHKEDCPFLPETGHRIYLGAFESGQDAVRTAKIISLKSDGCYFCLKDCSNGGKMKSQDWRIPENLKVVYSEN